MLQEEPTSTMKCPACGQPVPEAALFCPNCGRTNVSTDFGSSGSSYFSTATEAPPAEALPEMPPAPEEAIASAPTPVAAPPAPERELPAREAGRLVAAKVAIYGDRPPRDMDGAPEDAAREFR